MTPRLRALRAACALLLIPSAAAAQNTVSPLPSTAPAPEIRPTQAKEAPADARRQRLPATGAAPVPTPRSPEVAKQESPRLDTQTRRSIGRHNAAPAPRPPTVADVQAEGDCRERLNELRIGFEAQSPIGEAQGCSLPFPLMVSRLSGDVSVEPPAVMNCAMAEAAAGFVRDVVSPAAQSIYGSDLASVAGVSGYTCRPRNGSTKLSEHAFGNALDISRFVLADGTAIDVGNATPDDKARRFLALIRTAACGPFKTVLGPGSDADHADHLHVDLAERREGATFCQ